MRKFTANLMLLVLIFTQVIPTYAEYTTGGFGSITGNTTTVNTTGGFGSSTGNTTTSSNTGGFSSSTGNSTSSNTTSGFGSSTGNTSSTSSVNTTGGFGSSTGNTTTVNTTGGFGSSTGNTTTANTTAGFGSTTGNTSSSVNTTGGFGSSTGNTTTVNTTGGFGSSTGNTTSVNTTGGFGSITGNTTSVNTTGGFGSITGNTTTVNNTSNTNSVNTTGGFGSITGNTTTVNTTGGFGSITGNTTVAANTSTISFLSFFYNSIDSSRVQVGWTSQNASTFQVCYRAYSSSNNTLYTCIDTGTTQTATLTGLSSSTPYQWYVLGTGTSGSYSSPIQTFTTNSSNGGNGGGSSTGGGSNNGGNTSNTAPVFSTNPTAVANNDGTITFSWNATDAQNTTITYQVCYKLASNTTGTPTCVSVGAAKSLNQGGLVANTDYSYYVTASNNIGTTQSVTAIAHTNAAATGNRTPVVTLLEAKNIRATSATVLWNGSDLDLNAQLTYTLCYAPTSQAITTNCITTTNEYFDLTNLTPGIIYAWTVSVSDGMASSNATNGQYTFPTATVNPTNQLPSITLGNVTNIGNNTATLNYTATDPDTANLSIDICISTDRNNVTSSCNATTTDKNSFNATNLIPGVTYYWTARVSDGTFQVYSSNTAGSFTTTGTNINQIPFATLIDNVNTGNTTTTLRWNGRDNESDALTYEVCYSTQLAQVNAACVPFTTPAGASSSPTNPTTLTYDLTGLQVNTLYFWNVRVKDAGHPFGFSLNGAYIFQTGIGNGLPSTLLSSVTSPVTTSSVTLNWTSTNATKYDVYFGTSNPPALYQSNVSAQQITLPNLVNGTYYWNVIAYNANGQTAVATNGPGTFTVSIANTVTPPVTPVIVVNPTGTLRYIEYTASTTSPFRAKTLFAVGETIRYVLQVENLSTTLTQVLTFPDAGDEVQFSVNDVNGTNAYVAHADTTSATSITLLPGQIVTFTADTPSGAVNLAQGLYSVNPIMRATNSGLPTTIPMQILVANSTQVQTNYAPQVTLLNPANNTTVNGGNATLTWFGFDPNGDALTYDVYFDTNSTPTTKVATATAASSFQATGLVNGTKYFWYVVARDSAGLTGQSLNGTFNFTSQTATQNPSANATFQYTMATRNATTQNAQTIFPTGQNVLFEIQVRNLSQTAQTVNVQDATRPLFRVLDNANQQIFASPFTAGNQQLSFTAGEVKTFQFTWNQIAASGNQIAIGNYALSGDMNAIGTNPFPTTATTAFSIVAATNNPNLAPNVTLAGPSDNSTSNTLAVPLTWNAVDPNGDIMTYNVYVATSSANLTSTTPVASNLSATNFIFTGVTNTRYYWTVRATDGSLPSFAANGPFSFFVNTTGTNTAANITSSLVTKSSVTLLDRTSFTRDENVIIQLYFNNTGNTDQTLTFATNQTFDIVIQNAAGQVIYQSSRGLSFTQGQTSLVVPANSSIKVADFIWDKKDSSGQLVTSGTFKVIGNNLINNTTVLAPSRDISLDMSTIYQGGGGGGGGYTGAGGGGGGGGGSNVDTTTPTTIPATDTGEFLTVYGPLKFNLSNGVATVPVKHMDVGNGVSVQYDKGTVVTLPDGSRFTGTLYTPSCYTFNRLPDNAKANLPKEYTALYDCYIQYGTLVERFAPMLRIFGDLSRDITTKVSQPENLAIMFWDADTKTWTKIGGYSNFKAKRFDTYIKKSGVIGFFDTHSATGTTVVEKPTDCTTFSDTQFHWAKDVICTLEARGVVSGFSSALFRPDRPMTRAELVKIIMRLNGKSVAGVNAQGVFPDIQGNEWYAAYIVQAKNLGIISGYGDGYFRPNQFVNRAEAMKIILRGTTGVSQGKIDEEQMAQTSDNDDYTYFQDVRETDWFSRYTAYSFKRGIISGKSDGLFHGEQFATRAELAKIALMMFEFPNK